MTMPYFGRLANKWIANSIGIFLPTQAAVSLCRIGWQAREAQKDSRSTGVLWS
jgi:hypothetical protein